MKKFFLLVILMIAACSVNNLHAQVTIGSNAEPNANAVLDLVSGTNKGLLMPRVALTRTDEPAPLSAHVAGMTVYNTGTSAPGVPINNYVSPGFYYNDGTKWVRLPLGATNWFYMPSVSFDTSVPVIGASKNLYNLYVSQFGAPAIKSTGAPNAVPYLPAATDLYYYITSFDSAVFENISIDADGLMTYDVKAAATDCSFINIVFVLK